LGGIYRGKAAWIRVASPESGSPIHRSDQHEYPRPSEDRPSFVPSFRRLSHYHARFIRAKIVRISERSVHGDKRPALTPTYPSTTVRELITSREFQLASPIPIRSNDRETPHGSLPDAVPRWSLLERASHFLPDVSRKSRKATRLHACLVAHLPRNSPFARRVNGEQKYVFFAGHTDTQIHTHTQSLRG